MGKDVIIALDFKNGESALDFLKKFEGRKPYVKIGMELFYAEGPEMVKKIKSMGHNVFLDLKLHDIPNTVRGGMASLSRLGADMVNVHASGTSDMMKAAVEGLTRPDGSRPLIVAVTQLTSTSEERMRKELLISATMEETVVHYAKNACESGLDGVVCSPLESALVHENCGPGFITVTPGIRFPGGDVGDQARVTSPARAKELMSDYIVMGRPITAAPDPVAAYERAISEFTL